MIQAPESSTARATRALSRVKYWASRPLSPKAYWYLMGRFKPVRAVTSGYTDVDECLASGEGVVELLDKLGALDTDATTLHIGSGLGRVESHLRTRVRRCVGVDVSPSMVKRARRLVSFDNVDFYCTDGKDLSRWPDGSFQVIYSFLVFQHLSRPQFRCYVEEAHAKLSKKGQFVFQMMVDDSGTRPEPPPSHPYGLRYYRRAEVQELLERVGFDQIDRADLEGHPDDSAKSVGNVVFRAVKA